ncbi:DUF951 domain-containing protein [Tepidiforma bonchosmolovskayae]|uniref:DUF951 domain-containing protein n=1 Tax=Tepidiforma bonchosmolovskayae TaxID=2601677 RepID=A0ABX6BYY4_9CHLR|nr:DUF951 domain-containing protein [Tepidiforma bonchosmolovskayae]QFG01920.1 DUF951 domain-containing protein [Tepidiforma bonchosmolovskayae]
MVPDFAEGDVVRMKRQHPCGGWEWRIYRVGADMGIECLTCGRRVLLERRKFESRVRGRTRRED